MSCSNSRKDEMNLETPDLVTKAMRREKAVDLVMQLLVERLNLLHEGAQLKEPRHNRMLLHRLPFCFQQQVVDQVEAVV